MKMTLAYFDCFSGISGDMTLGALVHLGVPVGWLNETIRALPLDGFDITSDTVMRNGIQATHVTVKTKETHHHRHYHHIQEMIENSTLSDAVKTKSLAIFDRLAEAEANVHNCAKESVHFHEVGAIDAIVDIVGSCLGMEWLGIDHIVASALPMGGGFVECAHGKIPVPAPAVVELLKGKPVYSGSEMKELVTPTGASILVGLSAQFGTMPAMEIDKVGYGAGTRNLESQPNFLRIVLGKKSQMDLTDTSEKLVMAETCIDDMNPEIFSYLMDTLFADGALDVFWVPVQMKKNRPGILVKVLCKPEHRTKIVERIFAETTTLGVRFFDVYRSSLVRDTVEAKTEYGTFRVKRVQRLDGSCRLVPEYEVCRQIADERKLPLFEVYQAIQQSAVFEENVN